MSQVWSRKLAQWREFLVPEEHRVDFPPFISLTYLGFLFLPALWFGFKAVWLVPTLFSVALFLPVYFYACRQQGHARLVSSIIIAAIGFAFTPINASANTYVIYACASLPRAFTHMPRRGVLIMLGILLAYSAESWWLHHNIIVVSVTWIVAIATYGGSYFYHELYRKQSALKLSHEEVRRLAALAERERIGRDLHDLLGHTLSLITLKAELAKKLWDRDLPAARDEVNEIERVARDALAQVRRAVSGIRAVGLVAELASARLLLDSANIKFSYDVGDCILPPDIETGLALAVREAVMNIQRHACAQSAKVRLIAENSIAILEIHDDGGGGDIVPGNGLAGMKERLSALGATLEVHSVRGQGTVLRICVPITTVKSQISSSVNLRTAH